MIARTNCSKGKHHYQEVTRGQYYNYNLDHKNYDVTKYYFVTLKTNNSTQQSITLSNRLDSYFTIDYNKLMTDVIFHQKRNNNDTLSSELMRSILVNNSKINKKNLNKLDISNGNDYVVNPDFDAFKHNEIDDDNKNDDSDNNNSDDEKTISEDDDSDDDDDNNMKIPSKTPTLTDKAAKTVVLASTIVAATSSIVAGTVEAASITVVEASTIVAANISDIVATSEEAASTVVVDTTVIEASTGEERASTEGKDTTNNLFGNDIAASTDELSNGNKTKNVSE
jgi:hypothetical protein